MRFLKLLLSSSIIFALFAPATALAESCVWRSYSQNFNTQIENYITVGGCNSNEYDSSPTRCTESRPIGDYKCCCDEKEKEPVAVVEPPEFKVFEPQINLGVKFTTPVCEQDGNGNYKCYINWLGVYLTAIYNYALKIGGILAAVMLMAGGALWVVSGGDSGRINTAKEIITGSLIGLMLLFSSYLILTQINPELVKMRSITIGQISGKQMDTITQNKTGGAATTYSTLSCASNSELEAGVDFYATGYCKPTYENTDRFFCFVAMNCSCPLGVDTTKNCDKWFGNTFPGYNPCKPFSEETDYCNKTSSGAKPVDGSVAGPSNCSNLPYGTKICFDNKTYTITDTGGAIKGRRLDIWTDDCGTASEVSGVGKLTIGACK